jgi:putative transcriptional regulator
MPKSEKDLIKRDLKRDVWQETLEALQDIKAENIGDVYHMSISSIAEARHKIGLSQSKFALLLGVSKRTLQDWEQGRREPSGAAKSLLKIAEKRPDVLKEILLV